MAEAVPFVEKTEQILRDEVKAEHVSIKSAVDEGCGVKLWVTIVSPLFEGKPLFQRHRLVYGALDSIVKQIHAFSMKTYTPAEWEKIKDTPQAE